MARTHTPYHYGIGSAPTKIITNAPADRRHVGVLIGTEPELHIKTCLNCPLPDCVGKSSKYCPIHCRKRSEDRKRGKNNG